jgi:hypothetical protein
MQAHTKNAVIIFCVYPVLTTITAQAFQVLIWVSPESPNMELSRQFADDDRAVSWYCCPVNNQQCALQCQPVLM